MQGWRNSMEDAIICHPDVIPGVHFFGVFDGHGGTEVSAFVKAHLVNELRNCPSFKNKSYGKSFAEVFLKLDQMMDTKAG